MDNATAGPTRLPTVAGMQIRVTLHVPRRRPRPAELVVRWQGRWPARDLRASLARHLGHPVPILLAGGAPVPDDAVLGMPPLLDGVSLAVAAAAAGPAAPIGPGAALELAVVGGPDAGRSRPLAPPGFEVGRHPRAGLTVQDPALSRVHCRVDVRPDGVHLTDLGSTNGVLVDGRRVVGSTAVDARSDVVIGSSRLAVRRAPAIGVPRVHPGDGTVVLGGPAGTTTAPAAVEVHAPDPPVHPPPPRIPWVAALVPVPVAIGLALLLGPHLLAVALLGPVMVLGGGLGDRWGGRRQRRRAATEHASALASAHQRLDVALAAERRLRHAAHPDPARLLHRTERRAAGLWSGSSFSVRLGLGRQPSRATWVVGAEARAVPMDGVPVFVDLLGTGRLGVVGGDAEVRGIAHWLVGQLCAALPPDRLHLADDLLTVLPEWRLVPHASGDPPPGAVTLHLHRGGEERDPMTGRGERDIVITLATGRDALPHGCRAVLERADGAHRLTAPDGTATGLRADGVGPWWADRVARALAPLRTARAGTDGHGPPTLATLLGSARLAPDGIGHRWALADEGPVAVVGTADGRPLRLDLRRDGPHVLVGGTTGSGKSEFLRTLVTGLALESPPERLSLLLVDFKGGAAFGPCIGLPHVVGLVTDLDDHLVDRVLTSLGAELRRREELLAAAGASDVAELGPGGPPLPRLVVVVDELRALVDELPGFVSGLVRLAAQGRSLGIHLVLATQRPGGTITGEVRANVDLRVAFRVRDASDSVDVVDVPDAASIPRSEPGRGVARGGDGTLTRFRAALVAPAADDAPVLEVHEPPPASGPAPPEDRAAETARVVEAVRAAAAGRPHPPPAPPWLPPLPPRLRPADAGVGPGVVAVADDPARQRRSPVRWEVGAPVWRVVGRPLSGRSTALRAIVAAATATLPPSALHVHVVDPSGGLEDLRTLPHVGTWCRLDGHGPAALVTHLAAEVAGRRARGRDTTDATDGPAEPLLLLVVDGWEQLVEADDPRSLEPLSDAVVRVLRDGAGVGVRGAVSGGRGLLHSRWTALGGRTFLLGAVDALDAVAAGVRDRDLPLDPPPGRGVLAPGGPEVQVVHVVAGDLGPVGARWSGREPADPPWRYRPLPDTVRRADLLGTAPAPAVPGRRPEGGLLLGVAGPQAAAWWWDPAGTGGRLLVAGPPGSGRTTALLALAESAALAGRAALVVRAARRGEDGETAAGLEVIGPSDVDALVERRRADPRLVVLVDDADRLDATPVAPVLAEIGDLALRDGGGLVVAASTTSLRTRYRGLDAETARGGHAVLLRPGPDDGEPWGLRLPPTGSTAPGRGVLVLGGRVVELQVLLPTSARAGAPSGEAVRPGPATA